MLGRAHDTLTRAGFVLACAALAIILAAYNLEVIARYFVGQPTIWSADTIAYALCASIFLAFPDVTRRAGHVAITSLIERLSSANLRRLTRAISIIGAALCALAAWICGAEAREQFNTGIETVAAFAIPKGWLTGVIAYGFASSGLHLLRLAFDPGGHGTGVELQT